MVYAVVGGAGGRAVGSLVDGVDLMDAVDEMLGEH